VQGESVSAFLFDLHCKWRSCGASDCTRISIQGKLLSIEWLSIGHIVRLSNCW